MKSLSASFGRRGFGYVVALSLIVVFAGAAGMLAFENETEGGIKTYGDAPWWTAMMADINRLTTQTVSGDARVMAEPDTAIISISVVTQNRSAVEAQQQNANQTTAVINALHLF